MEMFHLDDQEIVSLLAKKDRAVTITLILDQSELRSAKSKVAVTQLQANKSLTVVPSSKGFDLTHTKAMVVDGTTAIVASTNLIASTTTSPNVLAANNTRDYGVVLHDFNTINEMTTVFKADVDNAKLGTKNTPPLAQNNLLWSPVTSEQGLTNLIGEYTSLPEDSYFIYSTVENLGDPGIMRAFEAAGNAGVDVRIITPKCVAGSGPRNFNFFGDMPHVKIAVAPPASEVKSPQTFVPYMHGKMILMGSNKVYLGSINFSTNSVQGDRELGITFTNDAVAKQLKDIFTSDWNNSQKLKDLNVTSADQVQCTDFEEDKPEPTKPPKKPRKK
jgi:phosphatidylserine/phosphatidylglycerophosphate/cardiolipin synthase-like enzyme